jgi:hypothetical protein
MLSVALLVSPLVSQMTRAQRVVEPVKTLSDAEIRQRIEAGVTRAVGDIEATYAQRTERLVKDIERRDLEQRVTILKAADLQNDYLLRLYQGAKQSKVLEAYDQGAPK